MRKGSKLYSILTMTCPQCQQEKVFKSKNKYHWKTISDMHKVCPSCGLKYHPEPGFYFGASYVSYAIIVAMSLTVVALLLPFINWRKMEVFILVIGITNVLFIPYIFRFSRLIWMNIFFKYGVDNNKKLSHHG